jgi:hypothetical protein
MTRSAEALAAQHRHHSDAELPDTVTGSIARRWTSQRPSRQGGAQVVGSPDPSRAARRQRPQWPWICTPAP